MAATIDIPVRRVEDSPVWDDDGIGLKPSEHLGDAPPIFGRCPVCQKPLRPRCKITGEPKAPPVGTGHDSRAKCTGCGAIICYLGRGEWREVRASDCDGEEPGD